MNQTFDLDAELNMEQEIVDGMHEKWWALNNAAKKIYEKTGTSETIIPKEIKNYKHSEWSDDFKKHENRLKQLHMIREYIARGVLPKRLRKSKLKFKEPGNNKVEV